MFEYHCSLVHISTKSRKLTFLGSMQWLLLLETLTPLEITSNSQLWTPWVQAWPHVLSPASKNYHVAGYRSYCCPQTASMLAYTRPVYLRRFGCMWGKWMACKKPASFAYFYLLGNWNCMLACISLEVFQFCSIMSASKLPHPARSKANQCPGLDLNI